MVGTKTCTKCGQKLPLSAFGKHRLTKDGLTYRCKECARLHTEQYRQSPAGIFTNLKGQSKFFNRGIVNFTQSEFIGWYENEPKTCVYCDLPEALIHDVEDGWNNRTVRLTIDRINNDLSYEKGNIVLACPRCNMIKSNYFSFNEMKLIGQNFVQPKWKSKLKTSKAKKND